MRALFWPALVLSCLGCACGREPIVSGDADVDGRDDAAVRDAEPGDAGATPARCRDLAIEPWDLTSGVWSRVFAPTGLSLAGPERGLVRAIDARDGDVVVGGRFSHAGPIATRAVAAWTEVDGWRPLGGGVDGEVTALARDADGTIFAARTIDASDADVLRFRDGAW
ncbi:MAG: hypothetical protein M3Y87_28775, partial [Myxococcota bacterium]|nr:hypothetical protein [Myxococcota bacterium]